MDQPDRDASLAALEAAERAADTEAAQGWRRYLASLATPKLPGAPRLPPPPTLYSAPNFRARISPNAHKKHYLELSDPSQNRLFAMLRWGRITSVAASPGTLSLMGALYSASPTGTVELSLPGVDTAAAASGLRKRLKLPRAPLALQESDLRNNAEHYDGLFVACTGNWSVGFEQSSFANLWLAGPAVPGVDRRAGVRLNVHVVGFLSMGRSGHLGGSRGAIEAVSITPTT